MDDKLTIEEIQDRVRRCEEEDRSGYEKFAKKWQEAWELKTNDTRTLQQVFADGQNGGDTYAIYDNPSWHSG